MENVDTQNEDGAQAIHKPWQSLFDSLDMFTDDFMKERNQLAEQVRESFD